MSVKPSLQKITEGKTSFYIYKTKKGKKGPGKKNKYPFYNPAMQLNRDLSILVCQFLVNNSKKPPNLIDGLAASGARGLRISSEVSGNFKIDINDWNKKAYNLIKKNIELLNLKNAQAENKNLNVLLSEKKYDYIDIDPFGSPVYFVDSAFRSIKKNGIISFTATDTATLCGVYPNVCIRRYGGTPLHSTAMKEIGLRILIAFICREAAKYDLAINPILSYVTDHYFRVYVKVEKGVKKSNESIKKICVINSDKIVFKPRKKIEVGPLWMGQIQDKNTIKKFLNILIKKDIGEEKNNIWLFLQKIEDESDAPAFYFNTSDIASKLKVSTPKKNKLFNFLRKQGYIVYNTHFDAAGFKTNAPIDKITDFFTK